MIEDPGFSFFVGLVGRDGIPRFQVGDDGVEGLALPGGLAAEGGDPADRGVAAADREPFNQHDACAGTRRSQRGAHAGNASADHRHVGLVAQRHLAAPRDLRVFPGSLRHRPGRNGHCRGVEPRRLEKIPA